MKKIVLLLFYISVNVSIAQNLKNNPTSNHGNKFEQLGTIMRDANSYRTASGAPGKEYWQQKADYDIDVTLDEKNQRIDGVETITYYNNSPDALTYLWLQLDENEHDPKSDNASFEESKIDSFTTTDRLNSLFRNELQNKHGDKIVYVTDELGNKLNYTINQTMMRVDLKSVLKTKQQTKLKIKWYYYLTNRMTIGGRGGYEYFPEDKNYIFTVAQWYPRMCVYSDYQGWNNKQFTGRGEFSLAFGNFTVRMTVPKDHVVASTGQCQNYAQILSPAQLTRWNKAQNNYNDITEIITKQECIAAEANTSTLGSKTYIFKADSIRDFAWTSSRKYAWDAMPIMQAGKKVMCMSFYPKESYDLYRKYSTKVVAHTIKTYSKYTINYKYPVAQSVEAASGMEYPMICFNYGRTEKDGTYSEGTKYGMIGVIIHEVGHNFFPMIINSDERNWSWHDEGLNTFMQFITEQEFDNNYPSSRGPAHKIVDYMKLSPNMLEPIMTNSENIMLFGPNAYGKPATALNILRETVMGRKLFDYAFKEYCTRWAYKHPSPEDFFRTMEDASAVDLDWFWRAWFYDITPVDISLDSVKVLLPTVNNNVKEKIDSFAQRMPSKEFEHLSKIRNREEGITFYVNRDTTLRDFYYYYKPNPEDYKLKNVSKRSENIETMNDSLQKFYGSKYYYELSFTNKGGTPMPIILKWNYTDGTSEIDYISAYIWRKNELKVTKAFAKSKEVKTIELDPFKETADIDEKNNNWPIKTIATKFELFKNKQNPGRGPSNNKNLMQRVLKK